MINGESQQEEKKDEEKEETIENNNSSSPVPSPVETAPPQPDAGDHPDAAGGGDGAATQQFAEDNYLEQEISKTVDQLQKLDMKLPSS